MSYIIPGDDFFNDKFPVIIQMLASFIDPGEMTHQVWLVHYEAFLRLISVPEQLIEDISARLNKLHTTPHDFIERINENADFLYLKSLPANEVVESTYHDKKSLFIHFVLDVQKWEDLLKQGTGTVCQSDLFRVIFQLYREELFLGETMNDSIETIILDHTVSYLQSYTLTPLVYNCFKVLASVAADHGDPANMAPFITVLCEEDGAYINGSIFSVTSAGKVKMYSYPQCGPMLFNDGNPWDVDVLKEKVKTDLTGPDYAAPGKAYGW